MDQVKDIFLLIWKSEHTSSLFLCIQGTDLYAYILKLIYAYFK